MEIGNMDAYYDLLRGIIKKATDDAINGQNIRDRQWLDSKDARELCEMAGLHYQNFRDIVLKKIQEHDAQKPKSRY